MKRIFYLSLVLLFSSLTALKAQLSITGEINARSEYRNGFKTLDRSGADPAFFTEQRSRLYTNYKVDKFEVQITLQDVRFWGANGQVHKTDNGMTALNEGWGRYYFSDKFSFKAGRQMINYDNDRFFGHLEWAMQGRRHDALLFMYEDTLGLKVHGGLAFNQNPFDGGQEPVRLFGTPYNPPAPGAYHATANYKYMQYGYLNKKYDEGSLSLYLVNEGRQFDSLGNVAYRQTYGAMAMKKFGDFKLNSEFFYQGGNIAKADLSAFMFSLVGTLKTDVTPLTVGIDYLSGDDPGTANKRENFAPAFGTNHAHYGFMDYFYVGNPHGNVGLQDIYFKTKFKLGKGALLGHVHHFSGAADILESDGSTADAYLGTELDLVYVQKLAPEITWKIGYSQMFASDSMELIKGGDADKTNNWAWTQIIFKPKFL